MEINSLIKFGLLGTGAIFILPKVLGSQEDEDAESGGGGVSGGGNAFFGDSDKGYRGAVAGQESGSNKTSMTTTTTTTTTENPDIIRAPEEIINIQDNSQTKKEVAVSGDNYDYEGRSPDSIYSYNPSSPSQIQNSSSTQRLINSINATPHPATNYKFSGGSVISVAPKKTFVGSQISSIGSFFGGLFG